MIIRHIPAMYIFGNYLIRNTNKANKSFKVVFAGESGDSIPINQLSISNKYIVPRIRRIHKSICLKRVFRQAR
jgi:hypothetical protein